MSQKKQKKQPQVVRITGTSQKPKDRLIRPKKALVTPEVPDDGLEKVLQSYTSYIVFGSDNLFPQELNDISKESPVHSGILKSKSRYMSGHSLEAPEDQEKLNAILKEANGEGQSLHAIHKLLQRDFDELGNAWLEIVTDRKRSFLSFFHRDGLSGRLMQKEQYAIFNPNWRNYENDKKLYTYLPLYPNFEEIDGYYRSCIHVKNYMPGYFFYGIPSWVAGIKTATIGHKTDKWNHTRLDNNMNLGGVLTVETNADPEDAKNLKNAILDEYTGEGNNAGLMVIMKEPGGEEATEFVNLTDTNDGAWLDLKRISTDELVIAHEWRRSLAGISDNTGFETDRILNDYSDVLSNLIEPNQKTWLDLYNRILIEQAGLDASGLNFVNKPPVQAKKQIYTGSQAQGLLSVINAYKEGQLSQESAIQILKTAYLVTTEEAITMIS